MLVAEGGFEPPTSGLWARRAAAAPLRFTVTRGSHLVPAQSAPFDVATVDCPACTGALNVRTLPCAIAIIRITSASRSFILAGAGDISTPSLLRAATPARTRVFPGAAGWPRTNIAGATTRGSARLSYVGMVQVGGIEPPPRGPKPRALPLGHTCMLVEDRGLEPRACALQEHRSP